MPRTIPSRTLTKPTALTILRRLGLSQRLCADISARARALRVGPEEVALAWGLIGQEAFYRAMADALGLRFIPAPFAIDRRIHSPHAAEAGAVYDASGTMIAAPQGPALQRFLLDPPQNCCLTSPGLLRDSLRRAYRTDAAWHAAAELMIVSPHASAQREGSASGFVIAAWLIALVAIAFGEPRFSLPITLPLAGLFIWTIAQRVMAIALKRQTRRASAAPRLAPADLPLYSILVPLYREERVIPRLVAAMERLDYPPEKLEVLFLVEEDDALTRAALARMTLQPFLRLVLCPPGAPRTKPRALNIGLQECRGRYIAIFDAEDSPEPDQLLKAAAIFHVAPADVACLQAEITVENGESSWLSQCFALEYAALFQIIVPGLCAFNLPVALGGTSNHFRRDVILDLGGWDAWNVTEDANLGIRLALHGYRVETLPSRTWEEAPALWRDWRQQRIRWIKGWMQTSLVHLHTMHRTKHRIGVHKGIGLLHHLVGTPVAVLLTPLFIVGLVIMAMTGRDDPIAHGIVAFGTVLAGAALCTIVALLIEARPALSPRRKVQAMALMPFYMIAISLGAWFALIELVRHPFRWNKTPHGESLPVTASDQRPRRKLWPGLATHPEKRRKRVRPFKDAQAPPRL